MKRHLVSLAEHMTGRGMKVAIACPAGGAVQEAAEASGLVTIPLRLSGDICPLSDWQTVLQLTSHLRRAEFNLVHAHGTKAALVTRPAAILAGTEAVFYTVHNSFFFEGLSPWKKQAMAVVEKIMAGSTDRIITVSENLRRELLDRIGVRPELVITIPNGIELHGEVQAQHSLQLRRHFNLPPLGRLVGTVARLAPQKGISCFLRAAAILCPDTSTSFVVAGDGPLREALTREARDLNLTDRVFFLGHREDIPQLLQVLDIFVLPSLTEGFPLSLLEAMAAGLPVVATQVGGTPEIVRHGVTGLLVPPDRPFDLACAVQLLLEHHDLAGGMGRAGRSRVEQYFSLEQMVDSTIEQYNKVLAGKVGKNRYPYKELQTR
jgi:glycosyltransferase involved in cell wall biosynthesis